MLHEIICIQLSSTFVNLRSYLAVQPVAGALVAGSTAQGRGAVEPLDPLRLAALKHQFDVELLKRPGANSARGGRRLERSLSGYDYTM